MTKQLNFKIIKDKEGGTALMLILLLIFVCGGVFGFIYEELFYRLDLGYFVKRGTTFGPWIPIYGFGALLIFILTYRLRHLPLAVFLIGGAACGVLALFTGYICFNVFGTRLWDYNNEILNFGNIGGFICLRSVMFFALSSLVLVYAVVPVIRKIKEKLSHRAFCALTILLGALFISDTALSALLKLKNG